MLVEKQMTKNPVTVTSQDCLATAQKKMHEGHFRRLPVVEDGQLLGIVTDRDIREHKGFLEQTKVNVAMTEKLVTVTPETNLEEAAKPLLKHKIGGLPVLEKGMLVGIITTSDILQAFLGIIGASEEGTARIDLTLGGGGNDLASASNIYFKVVNQQEYWLESSTPGVLCSIGMTSVRERSRLTWSESLGHQDARCMGLFRK